MTEYTYVVCSCGDMVPAIAFHGHCVAKHDGQMYQWWALQSTPTESEETVTELAVKVEATVNANSAEERAKLALEAWEYCATEMMPALAGARRGAVQELRALGYSLREVGQMLGISPSRVSQIVGNQ